jgi:predicted Zn-dependent protease
MKTRVLSVALMALLAVPFSSLSPNEAQAAQASSPSRRNGAHYSAHAVDTPRQAPLRITQGELHGQVSAVSSPEAVLARVRSANNVPAEIAPKVTVQQSNVLNAATDGQSILITSALLERLTTDDERAFVLSHELSHMLLQHIAKTQTRRVGLSLLDALLVRRYAPQGSLLQMASELGIGLVDKRSSRTFEYQADDLGVKLMSNAGYNPRAALQVFDILKAGTPGSSTPEFLQDHPITDSRIRALVEKYKLSP